MEGKFGRGSCRRYDADRREPVDGSVAVTNGRKLVAGLDGRSAEARRYKDLCLSLAGDLGGTSVMGAGQTALVRQAAAMIVQSEKLHGAVLRGEVIDTEQLTRLANAATQSSGR